jgi:hypothetical protein
VRWEFNIHAPFLSFDHDCPILGPFTSGAANVPIRNVITRKTGAELFESRCLGTLGKTYEGSTHDSGRVQPGSSMPWTMSIPSSRPTVQRKMEALYLESTALPPGDLSNLPDLEDHSGSLSEAISRWRPGRSQDITLQRAARRLSITKDSLEA